MIIHNDKNAARILAAILRKPLNVQDISSRCQIQPTQCFHTIKKLKDNGLIVVAKKVILDERPNKPVFFYKAKLDPDFFRFENGRFKVIFPSNLRLANGKKIDLKTLLESQSSSNKYRL